MGAPPLPEVLTAQQSEQGPPPPPVGVVDSGLTGEAVDPGPADTTVLPMEPLPGDQGAIVDHGIDGETGPGISTGVVTD